MKPESIPARSKIDRLIWTIGIGTLLTVLFISVATKAGLASAHGLDSIEFSSAPGLQSRVTPTASLQNAVTPTAILQIEPTTTFTFSLADLGYNERTLSSPYGRANYSFRLPEDWVIEGDATLDLDLSYGYSSRTGAEASPTLFGEIIVRLDDETLEIFSIDESILEHHRLSVSLPISLLASRTRHVIELVLRAGHLCEIPHRAALVIHPTSYISLTYGQRPLVPDLARYPLPFYQRAFELDSVSFVLPSQATSENLGNTMAVAAKLGDLTGNRMVISAITDLDLVSFLSTDPVAFNEHLIVIGEPEENQLLPLLNDIVELPVSLQQRQLDLVTQGPAAVAPGDTFTYTYTITNVLDQSVDLSLVSSLPDYVKVADCIPDCAQDSQDNTVTWSGNLLAPSETASLSLILKANDVLTGDELENTVTVIEAELGPLGADTLTSTVVSDSRRSEPRISSVNQGDFFFVYDGRAVAEGDGIIQEIISPWGQNRAILILTGLSDAAVRKASQAMSSEARYPGMSGEMALVKEALTPSETDIADATVVDMTFSDLGYEDLVVSGGGSTKQVDYFFDLPYGWQLTDEAFIDLFFAHSQLIDYEDSGLTVLLNQQPIASIALNDQTSNDGHLHIGLGDAGVAMGQRNRLTIEVNVALPGVCVYDGQAWVLIKDSSRIFLAHRQDGNLVLDLDLFPNPFHLNPALTDLMLVLPAEPSLKERQNALRLAATLGASAAGKTIMPRVMMDSDLSSQDVQDYHVIAIGRPTRNALVQQVNDQLPQPFLLGTDQINQRLDAVVFRLPPDINLGYLQLIPTPWNEEHALLAITGTTDESVDGALEVLTDRPWALRSGNLAMVRGEEVSTMDTRDFTRKGLAQAIATAVPELTPMAEVETVASIATPSQYTEPTPSARDIERDSTMDSLPAWVIPLAAFNGGVIIVILAIVGWRARQSRL